MNGQRVVHIENEDEFYDYCDRGPITLSRELAEELDVEEWEETLKGEREWEELQKEWAEEERRVEHPMAPSSPFHEREERPLAVVMPFPARITKGEG